METIGKTKVPETPEELFQRGEAAYDAGDFETALALLKQAAGQGHIDAQYKCSVMYLTGEGTPVDIKQALLWSEKAAGQGHVLAQHNCGIFYHNGEGTALDSAQSLLWYEKAAKQGYLQAQFNCGVMYENGEGTQADLSKALYWYSKAAAQGHPFAANNLGLLYKRGEEEELKKLPEGIRWESALFWFERAIRAGADTAAQFNYAETLYQRGRPEDLSAALEWFEKLAGQGDLESQRYCAEMYGLGEGTQVDHVRELMWNKKAAQQGDARSQFNCAIMYDKGEGTTRDMDQALMWYEAAARNGYKKAWRILYNELFKQTEIARRNGDEQRTLALCEKLGGFGFGSASNLCGILYADRGDLYKAFQWFLKGAEQGEPEAQFNCCVMYYNGDGMAHRDKATARLWFQKAAEQKKDMDIRKRAIAELESMREV